MAQKNVETSVKDEELVKKRRDQLVKAAVELFTKKGFHRTTTREIAKTSGFSIGTLYEYIRTKEDVLYLVCDDIYSKVSERLKASIALEGDGIASLRAAIISCIKVVDEMKDEVLVMYQEAKSLSKESLPYVLNKELEMATLFEEVLQHAINSGDLSLTDKEKTFYAHHILVQCQMWAFRRWGLAKTFTLQEFADLQTEAILNGITQNKPAPSI
ncbi:TetR family transcriptional regulator [Camelliibacillus cellulosilyticus]|uniref:TetR family transcriptional regulator n=1 Tax=Camelliibacillus cellulosilyticus TaxID=2174486 RepID=A0ABV9GRJ7_9BACL